MSNQEYPHSGQPNGFPVPPPAAAAPRRPAVLDVVTWAWGLVAVLMCVGIFGAPGGTASDYAIALVFALALAALIGFGCWKLRSGANGWRVFFTILSIIFAATFPFELIDPSRTLLQKTFGSLISALAVAGLVFSWLPASNHYFQDAANYRRAVKAQQYAEFIRNNPPPESVRRKMYPNQPPQPPMPPPGPPNQNQPPNHG
ncbi:hypothetical protein [Saccharopolyspora phatthalungensis]|uniref:Uncharacterized protein n=1 Tax=Saccharopolyspora phatthalungensis TaxID=664693 RepID=A0A840Q671_9PSEU|nr:hypothetical protein [Saccharopolyspora phatthalungensis]MBB5155457.1 hypothetical protein [Saccharopolyspora phatthalungensis]